MELGEKWRSRWKRLCGFLVVFFFLLGLSHFSNFSLAVCCLLLAHWQTWILLIMLRFCFGVDPGVVFFSVINKPHTVLMEYSVTSKTKQLSAILSCQVTLQQLHAKQQQCTHPHSLVRLTDVSVCAINEKLSTITRGVHNS